MIKFATLFSSSSGNCTLISNDDTNILVDAGVSASKIVKALADMSIDICEIDGIVVTHEHTDHIKAIGVLSRANNIPIYANEPTMTCIAETVGGLHEHHKRIIECAKNFEIRSMNITPFSIPHDAVMPMGYTIDTGSCKVSVATDTGHITKSMLVNMAQSDAVLIESNHDVDMLKNGRYPYLLKKRILSDNGHLSNDNAAWLATQLALWGTKKIILGHLSDKNNTADKAYNAASKMLADNNIKVNYDVILKVASKNQICMV